MVHLPINEMPLYQVDGLETQVAHHRLPRFGKTFPGAGFHMRRVLKREEEPGARED